LGRDRNQPGQSGRSSHGRHVPPGSQRESGTGRRATGIIVSDTVRTEVRDLMGDPHRDLEHLRKLAQMNPTMRFNKLYKIIKQEPFLQMVWQKVQTNSGSRTPGIDGRTKDDIDVSVIHTLVQQISGVKVKSPIERYDHVLPPKIEPHATEFQWLTGYLLHISNRKMTYPNH
jgi:hypothetical protein